MPRYFPPVVHGSKPNDMLLNRLDEYARWLRGSSFHRAVLRVSDDPSSPVVDYVTVLQQAPTCVVLMDYDMTLKRHCVANAPNMMTYKNKA